MDITLIKAECDHAEIIKNMYALYLHDLSAFSDSLRENSKGTYEFDSFSLLWEKEGVNPYFILANGEKAGFILLLEPPFTKKIDYLINDFFIYKRFRKRGVGLRTAQLLFEQKPGSYFVAQLERNQPAVRFWHRVYTNLGIPYEEYKDNEENEKILCQEFLVQ
ncbi:hypothetical protein A8F94_20635 [Bacillus sp. FJAT-27225]|uniref:GNAT family N-acetyltransferase n=1 Tax=Bacillus sp. FJAT-27225 TaxID=1743144 RepID=UPI00080C2441|nr:GNAT family N-acetyltransferase [Bacillus sp. FJAT-27225]OCA82318.1 hypothetical protein A8F94_20635 [Bacillus sp. FJAT-27225]